MGGSIVLLESPLGPRSFGRVWMKDTAGVESEGLSGGVSVSAPGFGVAGSAREIQAIREVKRVAPALVHQLLGNLPPAGVDGSAGHLECLQSLNPSQAKAVGRALGCSGGFVSIHGPPGTGKSQTLLQLINALHLQRMQQYHQGIEDIALGVRGTGAAAAVSRREQWLRAVAHAPRLLVCAHSNNAVRQLQERLEKDGFGDQSGGRYVPWSVRVSAEGAGSSGSPDLDKEVAQLLQLSREEVGKQYQEVQEEMDQLAMQLKRLLYERSSSCSRRAHCQRTSRRS
ncbi:unnamed protein product [Effrenium voratum]|nr:unnamed protein product [Effrenium voratum]